MISLTIDRAAKNNEGIHDQNADYALIPGPDGRTV